MAAWDAGVAPYAPLDGFWFSPLKVLEYMAASVCPVASELGDTAALLGHGSRGVLVRPGDSDALARALAALSREPERAWTLGERAKRWVAANRPWSANAQSALAALGTAQTKRAA
jgi:glycosyltransferase involved in cell wall biosynthesis